jgi:hypothetical protein
MAQCHKFIFGVSKFLEHLRIDINNKEYKLISLEHNSENGYFIATDFYYEGHEAGNTYDDLGHISKKEAVRLFNETVKSAKEDDNE